MVAAEILLARASSNCVHGPYRSIASGSTRSDQRHPSSKVPYDLAFSQPTHPCGPPDGMMISQLSSEISFKPVLLGAAILSGGAVVIGGVVLAGMAARGVNRAANRQLASARLERDRELAAVAARMEARKQASGAQRADAAMSAAARSVLESLGTLDQVNPAVRSDTAANDFLAEERARALARDRALETVSVIERVLANLPETVSQAPGAPFSRLGEILSRYRDGLESGAIGPDGIASLRTTAKRSIDIYFERLERARETRARLRRDADKLLARAIECRMLTSEGRIRGEARSLEARLVALMERRRPSAAELDRTRLALSDLEERVEAYVQSAALRTWTAHRVDSHLRQLGYRAIESPSTDAAAGPAGGTWRVPGGGSVKVAFHPDGRLAAKLHPEATTGAVAERTEAQWCADVAHVIRRLAEDGLQYQVEFERRLWNMPVAALETADEIVDKARARGATRQKGRGRR